MNRTYLIVPLIGMATFIGFYVYASRHPAPARHQETRMVDEYAARDGRKEAEAALAAGKLILIEGGPAVGWDAERREIAISKYGVELQRSAEVGTESYARYVDAFNRVMRPRIIARHGRNFFDELDREAIALMESRRAGKKGG